MHSLHVGPVKLPHPVRMPNGRLRTNGSESGRACSEDYTKSTPTKDQLPSKKGIRSYSLKHGATLEDYTIFEKPTIITAEPSPNNGMTTAKPKVKTVPLFRPKRSSRMSTGSCHIAIEEVSVGKDMGKGRRTLLFQFT